MYEFNEMYERIIFFIFLHCNFGMSLLCEKNRLLLRYIVMCQDMHVKIILVKYFPVNVGMC